MKNRILIIEDEIAICDLLRRFLEKRGFELTTANTLKDGEALIDGGDFDLLIVDLLLPDGDGMRLLEKAREQHRNWPVIIMTGIGFDEELLQEARRLGASGYISKTLPLGQLLMEIHRVLKIPE